MFQVEIRELSSNACRFCWACSFRKHPVNSKIYWNDLQSSSFTAPDERRAKRLLGFWGPISSRCPSLHPTRGRCWTSTKTKRLGNYSWLDLSWFIINQPLTNQPTTDILIWPDISCILWPCLTKLSHWIQVALPRHISCRELPCPGFVQPPGIAFSNYAGATKASLVIGDPMILADWSNLYYILQDIYIYIEYIDIHGNISVDIGSIYIYISFYHRFMSCSVHVLSCHKWHDSRSIKLKASRQMKTHSLSSWLTHIRYHLPISQPRNGSLILSRLNYQNMEISLIKDAWWLVRRLRYVGYIVDYHNPWAESCS